MSDLDLEAVPVAAEPPRRSKLLETASGHFRWGDVLMLLAGVAATLIGLVGWLATRESTALFFALLGLVLVMTSIFGPLRRQLSEAVELTGARREE